MHAHIYTHAHTKWKWKYNIHACMTFRLKLLGKWSLCSRVMLSVKDTVEFRQTATLAFTPSSLFSLFLPIGLSGQCWRSGGTCTPTFLCVSSTPTATPPERPDPGLWGQLVRSGGRPGPSGSRRTSEQCRQCHQQPQCPSECQPLPLCAAHIRSLL